jgi:rubrerythrin
MPDLSGSKTHVNLAAAFARESQAVARYLWFAQTADVEGRPDAAALFRSIADGEIGHAHGILEHLSVVGDPMTGEPIGETNENLAAAIVGETHDASELYPGFAADARAEGFDDVADWFETLARAEQRQAERLREGLDAAG